jgi:hypothetical protein
MEKQSQLGNSLSSSTSPRESEGVKPSSQVKLGGLTYTLADLDGGKSIPPISLKQCGNLVGQWVYQCDRQHLTRKRLFCSIYLRELEGTILREGLLFETVPSMGLKNKGQS